MPSRWITAGGVIAALAIAGALTVPPVLGGPPKEQTYHGYAGADVGAVNLTSRGWSACIELKNQHTMAIEDRTQPASLVVEYLDGREAARASIDEAGTTRRACTTLENAGAYYVKVNAPGTATWRVDLAP